MVEVKNSECDKFKMYSEESYLNNMLKIKALKFPDIPHYEWEGEIL